MTTGAAGGQLGVSWVPIRRSARGYRPPSRPGVRHDRCQAETSRESRVRPLSRGSGAFTLSSRHGGQVAWKAVPDPKRPSHEARWPRSPVPASWSRRSEGSLSPPCLERQIVLARGGQGHQTVRHIAVEIGTLEPSSFRHKHPESRRGTSRLARREHTSVHQARTTASPGSRWLQNCVAPDQLLIFQEFRRGAVFPPGQERSSHLPNASKVD